MSMTKPKALSRVLGDRDTGKVLVGEVAVVTTIDR